MCCWNVNGNGKKKSRFICCKCLNENFIGDGIQRGGKQREKYHVKNLDCLVCKGEKTKNVEIRYCDDYLEIMDKAIELHEKYYMKVG